MKFKKLLEGDSDWNESDEEGSDDTEDAGEIDYLTEAQVIYSSFGEKQRQFSVSCSVLAVFLPTKQFYRCVTFATAQTKLDTSFSLDSESYY